MFIDSKLGIPLSILCTVVTFSTFHPLKLTDTRLSPPNALDKLVTLLVSQPDRLSETILSELEIIDVNLSPSK